MACAYEQILVSGFTNPAGANGVYDKYTESFLPVAYRKVEEDGSYYQIYGPAPFAGNRFLWAYWTAAGNVILNIGNSDSTSAVCPDVLTWNFAAGITGTVAITEYTPTPQSNSTPSENGNTFGLPADVVALITSRFGSVARFLRLRNLGQV